MTISREVLMETARKALLQALAEKGTPVPADLDAATEIFGKSSLLDSLGLVTMVMELEERLEEEHGVTVVLADERAMSRRSSPFRTLTSLVAYMEEQLGKTAP